MYWRTAVRLYSIALPFYLMCLVMFYFPPLRFDIACELVYLKCTADSTDASVRTDCVNSRLSCPVPDQTLDDITKKSGWRWPLFMLSMWMPIFIVAFEMFANRI